MPTDKKTKQKTVPKKTTVKKQAAEKQQLSAYPQRTPERDLHLVSSLRSTWMLKGKLSLKSCVNGQNLWV